MPIAAYVLAGFVLLFIGTLIVACFGDKPQSGDGTQDADDHADGGIAKLPASPAPIQLRRDELDDPGAPVARDHGTDEDGERKRQKMLEVSTVVQAICAAALAFFALVQIFVGGCQWSATRDQYNAMQDANAQTDGVLALMREEQRPWLSVGIPTMDAPVVGEPFTGMTTFTNSGKTPARVTGETILIALRPFRTLERMTQDTHRVFVDVDIDIEKVKADLRESAAELSPQFIVPPSQSTNYRLSGTRRLTDDDVVLLGEGEIVAVIFVYSQYDGGTPTDPQPETIGCFLYDGHTQRCTPHFKYNEMK